MDLLKELLIQIELHSAAGIRRCFDGGISPNQHYRNEPLVYEFISEYTRTERFSKCVAVFVEKGLQFEDEILLSILLNDANSLEVHLRKNREAVSKRYTLRCA